MIKKMSSSTKSKKTFIRKEERAEKRQ